MKTNKMIVLGGLLALTLAASSLPVKNADALNVSINLGQPPIFYPADKFVYVVHEHGYYRTSEGHYYYYDKGRNGWHYGRNYKEGLREEQKRSKHKNHGNKHGDDD